MSNDFEIEDDAKAEKKESDAEVKGILDDAFARYLVDEARYGTIDLNNDPRNFLREAEEELLDAINYFAFEVSRIRRLNAALEERLSGARDITLNITALDPSSANWDEFVKKDIAPALERLSADRDITLNIITRAPEIKDIPEEPTV